METGALPTELSPCVWVSSIISDTKAAAIIIPHAIHHSKANPRRYARCTQPLLRLQFILRRVGITRHSSEYLFGFSVGRMLPVPRAILHQFQPLRIISLILECRIIPALAFLAGQIDRNADLSAALFRHCTLHQANAGTYTSETSQRIKKPVYSITSETTPAPTVWPPSRIAKFRPCSIAIGTISSALIVTLSPGITISIPSGSSNEPVTSVVRK